MMSINSGTCKRQVQSVSFFLERVSVSVFSRVKKTIRVPNDGLSHIHHAHITEIRTSHGLYINCVRGFLSHMLTLP